jgi:hypothetical protein
MNDKVYTVVVDGDKLKSYDTQTGSIQSAYTFNGTVVNGPIVTGDRVTVVFETPTGKVGRILSLPNFNQISSFNIS